MKKKYVLFLTIALAACQVTPQPDVSSNLIPESKLPTRWRGFNLLNKYSIDYSNSPFIEQDFRLIQKLGFNFVRLPMDYRVWVQDGDWTRFNEDAFQDIDQAIEWGIKYGIHVCINFHKAPGYTVNSPVENMTLWASQADLKANVHHWAYFAKRYKNIPNKHLSFNPINEPKHVSEEIYTRVITKIVQAIRKEDPNRLIIADGLDGARLPSRALLSLNIAQSTRGYAPGSLTHYKASWVKGSDQYSDPKWPIPRTSQYLYGPIKKHIHAPFKIQFSVTEPTQLRWRVGRVSNYSQLTIRLNGHVVWDKDFKCTSGQGEWQKAVFKPEWGIYCNVYNKDYTITIPSGQHIIEFHNSDGDWLTLKEFGFQPEKSSQEHVYRPLPTWGQKGSTLQVQCHPETCLIQTPHMLDREWLWKTTIHPWLLLEQQGLNVVVLEWGAYNKTPHDVVLRWMEDVLKNWQRTGWGWAFWNFRGSFGVLDSNRHDVSYEDWEGHKLDRKMLELLQKY